MNPNLIIHVRKIPTQKILLIKQIIDSLTSHFNDLSSLSVRNSKLSETGYIHLYYDLQHFYNNTLKDGNFFYIVVLTSFRYQLNQICRSLSTIADSKAVAIHRQLSVYTIRLSQWIVDIETKSVVNSEH